MRTAGSPFITLVLTLLAAPEGHAQLREGRAKNRRVELVRQ